MLIKLSSQDTKEHEQIRDDLKAKEIVQEDIPLLTGPSDARQEKQAAFPGALYQGQNGARKENSTMINSCYS